MKLLIMSDSHQNIDNMRYAAKQTNPDAIMHLGDHISDAQKLQQMLPDTLVYMVKGKCDPHGSGEDELFLTIENVKIFMTHGHIYGVKRGFSALTQRARQIGADIALFGHTHRAALYQEYGMWIMCPGQMQWQSTFLAASYGIVTIDGNRSDCVIHMFPNKKKGLLSND